MLIGLTGGIGSGKSAAAEVLGALGADLIDADAISHSLTAADGKALPAIRDALGDQAIGSDGALDRSWVRTRVFADEAARQQLNAILHPMIRAECETRIAAGQGLYRVLVVPLMVESGHWLKALDRLLVIDCPEATQIARVQARSGFSAEMVRSIMAQQATRAQRRAAADDLILNDGSLEQLKAHASALHARYAGMAAGAAR
ncbi:dephospho-CoA kinase [beta proteobacterium AAP99]|nr:dephospho-CoA kinase [beta proteobacterium AAP99]